MGLLSRLPKLTSGELLLGDDELLSGLLETAAAAAFASTLLFTTKGEEGCACAVCASLDCAEVGDEAIKAASDDCCKRRKKKLISLTITSGEKQKLSYNPVIAPQKRNIHLYHNRSVILGIYREHRNITSTLPYFCYHTIFLYTVFLLPILIKP